MKTKTQEQVNEAVTVEVLETITEKDFEESKLQQQEIRVGDKVRSFDFPTVSRAITGKDANYLIGRVEGIIRMGSCDRYKIKPEQLIIMGEQIKPREEYYYPPINGIPSIIGGITNGVERIIDNEFNPYNQERWAFSLSGIDNSCLTIENISGDQFQELKETGYTKNGIFYSYKHPAACGGYLQNGTRYIVLINKGR